MGQPVRPPVPSNLYHYLQIALVAVFCGLATFYSISIPPGEAVDEIPHFDYVRYVKETRSLPVQPMSLEAGVKVWVGHHPPLYYTLGALTIAWSDLSDWAQAFRANPHFVWNENSGTNGWNVFMHFGQDGFPWHGSVLALHVVRLLSVVLGGIAAYAIFSAGLLLFGGNPWLALGASAIMVLNPSFVFMGSTVHHDVLQAAIFSLAAWWLMYLLRRRPRNLRFYAIGGLLAGGAALTKLSGLTLLPVIGLALILAAVRERSAAWLLRRAAVLFGVALAVAGWWYVRNQVLYGDPLGWQMFLNLQRHMVRTEPYSWSSFTNEFLAQIGRNFWGGFGYMHITFPAVSRYLWAVAALGLAGIPLAIRDGTVDLKRKWPEWLVALSLFVLLFLSFVRFSAATYGAGHGRYLFPAAFSMGAFLMAGLSGFVGRRAYPVLSCLIGAGMLGYAMWLPVTRVLPLYQAPASQAIDAHALPSDATATGVPGEGGVRLAAYRLGRDRATSGQIVPVTLYWQASGPAGSREDPRFKLTLTDETEKVIDSAVLWPVPSLSPDTWSDARLYLSQLSLYLPSHEAASEVSIALTPVSRSDSGQAVGETVVLARLPTRGAAVQVPAADVPELRSDIFASEIRLRSYDFGDKAFTPGSTAILDLYWQVLRVPAANYTVFIHLVDQAGKQVFGFDRLAGGESMPATLWQAGQVLRDSYPLVIPPTLPPGQYTVRIGMYTWPSMQRLQVSAAGNPPSDTIDLGSIQIVPQ